MNTLKLATSNIWKRTVQEYAANMIEKARLFQSLEIQSFSSLVLKISHQPNHFDQLAANLQKAANRRPINIDCGVYIIELCNSDPREVIERLRSYRKIGLRNKPLPPPNKNLDSSVLYVGKSKKDLRKRLEEHLGEGRDRFTSLRLSKWFHRTQDPRIRLTVYFFEDPSLLDHAEAAIASALRPLCGRQKIPI